MGFGQIKELATNQVLFYQDDFLEENLKDYHENWQEIFELAKKIIKEKYEIQTIEEVYLILKTTSYDVEEMEIY
jgi:hypothetical protein